MCRQKQILMKLTFLKYLIIAFAMIILPACGCRSVACGYPAKKIKTHGKTGGFRSEYSKVNTKTYGNGNGFEKEYLYNKPKTKSKPYGKTRDFSR